MSRAANPHRLEGGGHVGPPSDSFLGLFRIVLIGIALIAGTGLVTALLGLYAFHNIHMTLVGGAMILASGTVWSIGAIGCIAIWLRIR